MRKSLSLILAVLMVLALLPAVKLHTAAADTTTVTDTLTRDTTGITGTNYDNWSEKTGDSGTVYAGQSAGGNNSIQLRSKNSNSGIINTASVGNVRKIVVTWNSNTSAGRQLDIYGSSSAFSAPSDLYASSTHGTLLGSIVCGTSTELNVTDNYAFIGMRSNVDAMYIEKIEITWAVGGSVEPPATYTVTLDPGDGEGEAVTVEDVTSPYTLPDCPAAFTAPDGKVFAGWTVGTDTTLRAPGFTVSGITGDFTVTAQWGFEITFDHNDDDTAPTTEKIITGPDGILTAQPDKPVFAGHTFVNWFSAPTAGTAIDLTQAFAQATTVYAQWEENTDMQRKDAIAAGDEVVIYNAGAGEVMTGVKSVYNNTKNQLVADKAVLTGDVLSVPTSAAVFTVSETVDGTNTYYSFKTADNMWLSLDGTHVELVADESNNTLFTLTGSEGTYVLSNTKIESTNNYLECYKDVFTCYKEGSGSAYKMNFYAVPGEGPEEPPIVEPTGDTIILFTNDVHCQIDAKARTYENGKVKDAGSWGYGRVAGLKKELESAGNEVILVDAGDHTQGGPIGSLTHGEAIIDIMNAVGYDLAILGNHEFDYGMTQLFSLIEQAHFPYISANFIDLKTNALKLNPYKIFEANGKKIAFVGLSTPESIVQSTPTFFQDEEGEPLYSFCQDETGEGVYTVAQNAINAAKDEGADYVIILGHMGTDDHSSPWKSTEIIANITGADVFIDGHSHSVFNDEVADKDGHMVLHVQTGTKLENLGKLTIKADGTMTVELLLNENASVEPDPDAKAVIDTINEEFEAILATVVAYTDHALIANDPNTGDRLVRFQETNLGDLCADAYRYMFDSDIAFVNGGGVRANITDGDITFGNIITIHPFCNAAVLAEVTGQQILDALEMGARSYPDENGGFLQVSGLTYEIHSYIEPNCVIGSDKMWNGPVDASLPYRVQNVRVMNKETGEYEPIDLTKKYTLASHNYMLLDKGDGFAMFGRKNIDLIEDSGKLDNQVLIDYIQSMPEVDGKSHVTGYTDPKGEGRIAIYTQKSATIYGENVIAADVMEEVDGEDLFRYDIKIKDLDPKTVVVGMQVFVQIDTQALSFVKATTQLDGTTGVNEKSGLISFAWVSNDDGITAVEDGTVIVSLYLRLKKPLVNGDSTVLTFVPSAANPDVTSGYSYASGTTICESDNVKTENGSITFNTAVDVTLYGESVNSLDVMTIENGTRLYRYNIRVKDLPEAGLKIDSAQISLIYDSPLVFDHAEGPVDWTAREKSGKLMLVWASETPVMLHNDDVVLTVYFTAPLANGEVANVKFAANTLNTVSAVAFVYGGVDIEAVLSTIDGTITFVDATLGDVNLDGRVTAADAALVLRALVGLNALNIHSMLNADVNGDIDVTAADAAIILRYIVKLIDRFPIEENKAS